MAGPLKGPPIVDFLTGYMSTPKKNISTKFRFGKVFFANEQEED